MLSDITQVGPTGAEPTAFRESGNIVKPDAGRRRSTSCMIAQGMVWVRRGVYSGEARDRFSGLGDVRTGVRNIGDTSFGLHRPCAVFIGRRLPAGEALLRERVGPVRLPLS
jgi:hypothetical protein